MKMKCGTVSLIGRPNVGKSSLINALLRTHAVIVSPKPQTTRNSIRCIYNDDDSQIIFTDTPGLYRINNSRDKLGIFLNHAIADAVEGSDVILWLVDAGTRKLAQDDYEISVMLPNVPVILVASKSDRSDPALAFALYDNLFKFTAKISVSVKLKRGLDKLLASVKKLIPDGPALYDPDILMDTTEKFMASEIIRGKILMFLRDEIPHRIAVEIDEYKSPDEFPERKALYIRASLIAETDGQKKIIIGSDGSMIKKIGMSSRAELESVTGHKVFLDLWVKVVPNWRKDQTALKRLGYA